MEQHYRRNSQYSRRVLRGKRTLKSEEAALVTDIFGRKTLLFGPYVVRLSMSSIKFLDRFTANSKEYLCITYKENPKSKISNIKHMRGPCSCFLLPSYQDVQVKSLIILREHDVLCRKTMYGESYIRGPLDYMPEILDETLEVYNRKGVMTLSINLMKLKTSEKVEISQNSPESLFRSKRENSFLKKSFRTFPSNEPETTVSTSFMSTFVEKRSQPNFNNDNFEDVKTITADSSQYIRIISSETESIEHKKGPCSVILKKSAAENVQVLDLISLKVGDELCRVPSVSATTTDSLIQGPCEYMPEPSDHYGIVYRNGIKSLTVFYFYEIDWKDEEMGNKLKTQTALTEENEQFDSIENTSINNDRSIIHNKLHQLEFYRGKDKCLVWEH